ncbi:MAG: sortase, partial [Chloroflexota bacterium]
VLMEISVIVLFGSLWLISVELIVSENQKLAAENFPPPPVKVIQASKNRHINSAYAPLLVESMRHEDWPVRGYPSPNDSEIVMLSNAAEGDQASSELMLDAEDAASDAESVDITQPIVPNFSGQGEAFAGSILNESTHSDFAGFGNLKLPGIDINEAVQYVPIIDGRWNLRGLDDGIGLLEGGGQHPGDDLSMIFVGHVTTRWPIYGAFGYLERMSLGDEVEYVVGAEKYVYKISRFIQAHPSRADLLFQEDENQIILVTCSGYDLLSDVFETRLIAYATLDRIEALNAPDQLSQ